ncbi:Lrp/AsnC family transcriptional regulator [Devosia sp.]|uniref:Lrp/AsnC family transcriptional regulator n=1 Tax=Devosia sp. TaxID=1871048 RepID=UPI0032658461
MNAKDHEILSELERDGRITNLALAAKVGLSPSACLRRVQDMERSGVIAGYRVVTDRVALGVGFIAYIAVGLSDHSKAAQRAFERAVAQAVQVRECHNVTGTIEYILRVEVADIGAYKSFHTDVLGTLPAVHALTTYVVLDSTKDLRA